MIMHGRRTHFVLIRLSYYAIYCRSTAAAVYEYSQHPAAGRPTMAALQSKAKCVRLVALGPHLLPQCCRGGYHKGPTRGQPWAAQSAQHSCN
jgi:hypothetical protein